MSKSKIVSHMADSLRSAPFTASVGFDEAAHNELEAAELTAAHCSTRHVSAVVHPRLEEVLDPGSGEPVGYGERGERVVTSFGRGFIPLLRYRTKDLVVKVPHTRCDCGRTGDLYEGGIRNEMLKRVAAMKAACSRSISASPFSVRLNAAQRLVARW